MNLVLQIYLIGVLVAFIESVYIMRDRETRLILLSDLTISFILSLCSWVTVFALWVGSNIKRAEDKMIDNKNKKYFK
jgi:hypothetical protein